MSDSQPPVRVFGVRHHGPGSARALVSALDSYQPDCILIEGPSDADDLLGFVPAGETRTKLVPQPITEENASSPPEPIIEVLDLAPPVALLAWDKSAAGKSAFWPFASFSPEWQAMVWGRKNQVATRFMDLPAAMVLAESGNDEASQVSESEATEPDRKATVANESADGAPQGPETDAAEPDGLPEEEDLDSTAAAEQTRSDPIARLASAAGYDDPEAWWEDAVEMRFDGDPFDLLTEAIGELRALDGDPKAETLVREAQMRKTLRAASKEGFARIAVVCGAFHAPALTGKLPSVSADNALLRGLPKVKAELTWVPWTHQRLSFASGYGAGIDSPGWYHHLFVTPDQPVTRWLTKVAGVLRDQDLPVSSAHIIEGVRLAETLAVLRGRPMAGLPEVTEATWSVLCEGNPVTLELVTRDAVVGQTLGQVPDGVPTVPLEADLRATIKRLRMKLEAKVKVQTLDLRKANDLARSQLLHRLTILEVPWGTRQGASTTGTFKEVWELEWQPELAVALVDAASFGTTLESAAGAALLQRATTLSELTEAVEESLLAELPQIMAGLLAAIDERAAHEADIVNLLAAVPPLARAQRYGNVRGTDTGRLAHLAESVLARACAGLAAASSGLADEAAAKLRDAIDQTQAVIMLLPDDSQGLWTETLKQIVDRRDVPGVIAGRVVRLLLDGGELPIDDVEARLSRTLSVGADPMRAAQWIEAFLAGNPLFLIYQPQLLRILDGWVSQISDEGFVDVLPVIRRAFGQWQKGDRDRLATKVANLDQAEAQAGSKTEFVGEESLLATASLLLGGAR